MIGIKPILFHSEPMIGSAQEAGAGTTRGRGSQGCH